MLRQALTANSRSSVCRRWLTAAKGFKGSKRGLNPDQLSGGGTTAASTSKPTSPTPEVPPTPPPPVAAAKAPLDSGGGNSSLLPLGVVGALALGGAAYYYYGTTKEPEAAIATQEPSATDSTAAKALKVESTPKEKEESKEVKAVSAETPTGNRVVSIAMPPKMKNSGASSPPPPLSHPDGGNRVLMVARSSTPAAAAVEDTSQTQAAVQALKDSSTEEATAALVESHQSLWSAMDASFFADLDSLSNSQLKARIVQLAAEMKDRTKWEAVRLKEFLAMKEKETADKYEEYPIPALCNVFVLFQIYVSKALIMYLTCTMLL